jgi:hypothetical protein
MWVRRRSQRSEFNRQERLAAMSRVYETVARERAAHRGEQLGTCAGGPRVRRFSRLCRRQLPVKCLLALWP